MFCVLGLIFMAMPIIGTVNGSTTTGENSTNAISVQLSSQGPVAYTPSLNNTNDLTTVTSARSTNISSTNASLEFTTKSQASTSHPTTTQPTTSVANTTMQIRHNGSTPFPTTSSSTVGSTSTANGISHFINTSTSSIAVTTTPASTTEPKTLPTAASTSTIMKTTSFYGNQTSFFSTTVSAVMPNGSTLSPAVGVILGVLSAIALIVIVVIIYKYQKKLMYAIRFRRLQEVPMDDLEDDDIDVVYAEHTVPIRLRL